MQKNIKWLLILVVILLQLALNVRAQVLDPSSTTVPIVSTTTKPSASTTVVPTTTTAAPVPSSSSTLSTLAPVVPSSSSALSSSVASSTTTTTIAPTTSSTQPPSTTSSSSSSNPTTSSSSIASSSSAAPSATNTEASRNTPTNNTPLIVGCVVGGVVGIALIGGVLACVNRRGGCTKRRETKKSDFEDYGLGDFPHHRATAVAAPVVANNTKPVSPTIPRLNDQGNYYADDGYAGHYGGGYVDNNMDYGMQQQHGGYYYPQQQQQQEYYDDGNYYYDNNTSATAYSSVPPMQQHSPAMHNNVIPGGQQGYVMGNVAPPPQPQHDIYKPDDVGSPINNSAGNVPHNR